MECATFHYCKFSNNGRGLLLIFPVFRAQEGERGGTFAALSLHIISTKKLIWLRLVLSKSLMKGQAFTDSHTDFLSVLVQHLLPVLTATNGIFLLVEIQFRKYFLI